MKKTSPVVSLDPERCNINDSASCPYSAEKLLVNTVTSYKLRDSVFCPEENVRYYLIHQLNKKYIENLLH
jgi:hypothetical protein